MTEISERINNDTFNSGPNTDLNACVGSNGPQNHSIYADGYLSASKRLLESMLLDRKFYQYDSHVFPVAFCIRHGIELYIKQAIVKVVKIRTPNIDTSRALKAHDIGKIWDSLKQILTSTDRRFNELVSLLDPYVQDYAEIDPTGQTFRYPENIESVKHLENTPLINIGRLYSRLKEMEKLFKKFESLCIHISNEYSKGSYTKSLSRHDLEEIANILVPWNERHSVEFINKKNEIKSLYSIGSAEFSNAITVILKNHYLSRCMGLECKIKDIDTRSVSIFMSCSDRLRIFGEKTSYENIDGMFEYIELKQSLVDICLSKLTRNQILSIRALFYFGRDCDYCEDFYLEFDSPQHLYDEKYLREAIGNLLSKVNFNECVLKGLEILGQYRIYVNAQSLNYIF